MYIFTLSKYTYTHLQNNTHLNSKQTNFQTLTNTHTHTHTHTPYTKRLKMVNVYFEVFTLQREQKCYYTFKIVFNVVCNRFRILSSSLCVLYSLVSYKVFKV